MTWSAPMTAVAGATFTAAQFNQYVRDNLNETAPAKSTGAEGQYFVSSGVNAIAARRCIRSTILTAQTTTATGYTDLATVGPQVSTATGTSCLVIFAALIDNTVTNGATSVSVACSGATTVAANNDWRIVRDGVASTNPNRYASFHIFSGLNPGTNIFTMKYLVGSGTATFSDRELAVLPF